MKNLINSHALVIWLILLAMFVATPARTEIFDYGAFEDLFGEAVTTSATGQPQRASEVPANMTIITADDIRRSGARDISGVLRHVGGIDMLQWTAGQTDVSVRGYNREYASRLLVLIDGRQVYADYFGFVVWDALPVELSAIRQIEVVKGPNSALFGFNAVGGVINIVTYNPMQDDIGEASAMAGTQDLIGGSLLETFRVNDRFAFRLSAGGHSANDFSTDVPRQLSSTGLRETGDSHSAFNLDSIIRFNNSVHLRIDAGHSTASRNDVLPSLNFSAQDHKATFAQAKLTADTDLGLWELRTYTNWVGQMSGAAPQGKSKYNNRVNVVRLQDILTLGTAHTVRATAEYRHNRLHTTPTSGGTIFYDVFSVGGMWDWKVVPSLSLTNAVRFDRLALGRKGSAPADYPFTNSDWDRTLNEVSFNSGLVWRVAANDVVRLTAARGVQLPNLTQLGGLLITSFANIAGQPGMKTSPTTNYEIGWDHTFAERNTRIRTNVFYQTNENQASVEGEIHFGPGAPYFGPTNIGGSKTIGFELGLDGEFKDHWRWGVSYRAQDVNDDFDALETGLSSTTNYEDTTPTHLVHANLGWSSNKWEVDGFVRYQSKTSGLYSDPVAGAVLVPIDDYAIVDARVGYQLTDWVILSVSGQNLLSSPQEQTSGPEVERSIIGKISVRY